MSTVNSCKFTFLWMCNYLFILTVISFLYHNVFTETLQMIQVSFFQVGTPQYQSFSETRLLFPGKGNKEYKAFLSEFGVLDDLKIVKECSRNGLNKLFVELRQRFISYYSLKGVLLSFKKKPISIINQSQVETSNQMFHETSNELFKLLNQIFSCIVIKKASKYKNYRVSINHLDCTIYSYVYYLSMKKLSKRIIDLLEETLSSFTKSKCNCQQFNTDFKQSSCYYLFFSVKAIKSSITTETSYYSQYKRIKKNCEPYVFFRIRKILSFK
ncbi:uncharacterized protein ELE39_001008 [Cryptosporidium sp. chipmunk genotype I]|uniref:uncharacterized protein n=1 Tax=Cryptosporidium sp. chipmunk genotype I TaxID=1280935 RepID=UPI00351A2FA4|nr:hypothetical protein ELE39_001008 [Cryptosporidium sp. chipmunk genotype I]